MSHYQFLGEKNITFHSIWAWARRLVNDLNTREHEEVPEGVLLGWPAGTPPPLGWRRADGSAISVVKHPKLFLLIGYRYGGSGDVFHLPDHTALAGGADVDLIIKV